MEEVVGAADTSGSLGSDAGESLPTTTEVGGDGQAAGGSETEPILYSVKVDGREEKVTFDELTNGYQRGADYTRKTQAVAAERAELAQLKELSAALERNPRGTLVALAGALGVEFGQVQQAFQPQAGDTELDPLQVIQRDVSRLTQQIEADRQASQTAQQTAAQQANVKAQIEGDLADLHSRHGQFPDMELIQYAVDHRIENLGAAYRAWQYDALDAQRLAEQNAATEAKRRAQVVEGGHNTAAGATRPGTAGSKPTLREAFTSALASESA